MIYTKKNKIEERFIVMIGFESNKGGLDIASPIYTNDLKEVMIKCNDFIEVLRLKLEYVEVWDMEYETHYITTYGYDVLQSLDEIIYDVYTKNLLFTENMTEEVIERFIEDHEENIDIVELNNFRGLDKCDRLNLIVGEETYKNIKEFLKNPLIVSMFITCDTVSLTVLYDISMFDFSTYLIKSGEVTQQYIDIYGEPKYGFINGLGE